MLLKWFDGREASEVGTALADNFVLLSNSGSAGARRQENTKPAAPGDKLNKFLQKFLQRVDREVTALSLNVFKRAKLANSFKWRLLEKGVDKELVEELTQALVRRLTLGQSDGLAAEKAPKGTRIRRDPATIQALMRRGTELAARREHAEAINCFEELLQLDPRNAVAHNSLGVSLSSLGRYDEAWAQFREAIGINESYAEAQFNLGSLLRTLGWFIASEQPLRRALKLRPGLVEARISLGATLFILGRMKEAKELLESALQTAPRHVEAMQTMGQLLARAGEFAEAETWFRRALEVNANAPHAWVGLAGLRRMGPADGAWLKGAQQCADSGLSPLIEANLRYAIGKYYDELGEFERAFRSVQRANELVKNSTQTYSKEERTRLVEDLIQAYPAGALARPAAGASDSALPVFVVGMPRSGTTLVAQIIDSHPAAKSAGELEFWGYTVQKNMPRLRHEPPDDATRRKVAEKYLRVLTTQFADAQRVVDKAPFNSDILGVIHSVFPRARFIYVQRDPIDSCLSCYFQDFPPSLGFTQDLSDLAHYYRQHRRLIEHWRAALPAGTLLDVPYEALVEDQETWTRKIIDFIGLQWDPSCLEFHKTERTVLTASYWQVRQKVYKASVGRWRNYEKFLGPLRELKNLA
jgi:tetratricopeptide (TPR) repeat protein